MLIDFVKFARFTEVDFYYHIPLLVQFYLKKKTLTRKIYKDNEMPGILKIQNL